LRGCERARGARADAGRARRAARRPVDHGRLAALAGGLPARAEEAPLSFQSPLALLALLVLPVVVALYVLNERRRGRRGGEFANPALLPNLIDRVPGWRRHVPPAILVLALTLMLVGLARPRAALSVSEEDATVVLAIDTSRSMAARDVRPTRLGAAKL